MGEPEGAEWRDERTNSGESILSLTCARKAAFQGAAALAEAPAVVDMVRRVWFRREKAREAIFAVVKAAVE